MKVRANELVQGDEWSTGAQTSVVQRIEHVEPQQIRVFLRIYPANGTGYSSSILVHENAPIELDYRKHQN